MKHFLNLFQTTAAFSALGKVISQTLSFSGLESSNPADCRDAGCTNLIPSPTGPQSSDASSGNLSLLHLPILMNSKFKVLLDFLMHLFLPKNQSEVPSPLPSKRGIHLAIHQQSAELTALLVQLGLG